MYIIVHSTSMRKKFNHAMWWICFSRTSKLKKPNSKQAERIFISKIEFFALASNWNCALQSPLTITLKLATFCVGQDEQPSCHFSGEWWGANENCTVPDNTTSGQFLGLKRCQPAHGITENCTYAETPSQQFWEKYVLNITDGLDAPGDLGGFKYDLPLALLLSWIVVFLCLMKGVKSSGKVGLKLPSGVYVNPYAA